MKRCDYFQHHDESPTYRVTRQRRHTLAKESSLSTVYSDPTFYRPTQSSRSTLHTCVSVSGNRRSILAAMHSARHFHWQTLKQYSTAAAGLLTCWLMTPVPGSRILIRYEISTRLFMIFTKSKYRIQLTPRNTKRQNKSTNIESARQLSSFICLFFWQDITTYTYNKWNVRAQECNEMLRQYAGWFKKETSTKLAINLWNPI